MNGELTSKLGTLDYCAIGLYLLAIVVIGVLCSGQKKDSKSYMLGGGKMPFVALAISCLMAALSAGRLGGACLDVQAREPLPSDSPLRRCPNLWLFPHSSALSPNYMDLYAAEVAEKIAELRQRE